MLVANDFRIIDKRENIYISFPDVIKSIYHDNKFFMIYRSADNHHPTWSFLHLLVSHDKCKTWEKIKKIHTLKDEYVWNCPRLYYNSTKQLSIVCDIKNSTNELYADFNILIITIDNEEIGKFSSISYRETQMKGMVPDKVFSFKNKLFCANHLVDRQNRTLTQLINCSRDDGKTWYDCSILARKSKNQFCEASIINYKDKFLIAYLRDNKRTNSGNNSSINNCSCYARLIYKYKSYDGISWEYMNALPVWGHRITTLLEGDKLIASYRNTKEAKLSVLTADIDKDGNEYNIEILDADSEKYENLFHFGYTGLVKCDENKYFLVYYIKNDEENPYIKSCFLENQND